MGIRIAATGRRLLICLIALAIAAMGIFALSPTVAFATADEDSLAAGIADMDQFGDAELKAQSQDSTPVEMYRLYNPNSGEHLYTKDDNERKHLTSTGWYYEGIGWTAPKKSSLPVYRLYNKYTGDHHYTLDPVERAHLIEEGWNNENIGWYSDEGETVAIYRQYNPRMRVFAHNFTADKHEDDVLGNSGWRREGVSWHGLSGAQAPKFNTAIYLDAGHGIGSSYPGQYDSGAVGSGYREADLTAELVNLTAKYARELYGLNVYTNVGTGVQYYNRQADARKHGCTALVSIHFNAGGGSGSESYIHTSLAASRSSQLQSIMHKHLLNGTGLRDRGAGRMALSVCNGSSTGIPATLLEIGFIDNWNDMSTYQSRKDKVARELAAGLYEAAQAGF